MYFGPCFYSYFNLILSFRSQETLTPLGIICDTVELHWHRHQHLFSLKKNISHDISSVDQNIYWWSLRPIFRHLFKPKNIIFLFPPWWSGYCLFKSPSQCSLVSKSILAAYISMDIIWLFFSKTHVWTAAAKYCTEPCSNHCVIVM